ncbi:helix-turn-helix domain-containing protein [Viscerimonas tarda]
MYLADEDFIKWAERISGKLTEIGKDLKQLVNTGNVFEKDDKPLDNQNVSLILNVSHRTLQRYRTEGLLPFFKLGQKIYYRTSDIREFVYRNGDHWDRKNFEENTRTKDAE